MITGTSAVLVGYPTGISNTAFSLNVAGLTADTNAGNVLDAIAISDASDSNSMKKITISQLKTLVDTDTNTTYTAASAGGLSLSDTAFSLDIAGLGDIGTSGATGDTLSLIHISEPTRPY